MVLSPSLSSLRSQHVCVFWVLLLTGSVVPKEIYLNKIAVHIKGDHHEAERVAREAGLHNLGQVSDHTFIVIDLYIRLYRSLS